MQQIERRNGEMLEKQSQLAKAVDTNAVELVQKNSWDNLNLVQTDDD
jgi:hypothetical protein